MAKTKDEIEEEGDGWSLAAASKGFSCERCGGDIPYEERETFFAMKLCDWCRNQSEKDD